MIHSIMYIIMSLFVILCSPSELTLHGASCFLCFRLSFKSFCSSWRSARSLRSVMTYDRHSTMTQNGRRIDQLRTPLCCLDLLPTLVAHAKPKFEIYIVIRSYLSLKTETPGFFLNCKIIIW
jgi:hypothetical protein